MLDIFSELDEWVSAGKEVALATVTYTWGSAPRLVGAALATTPDMEMLGSVSGGCVEGDVLRKAQEVLRTGVPQTLHYGISHEEAWEVGLSCGGKLGVLVERFPDRQRPEEMEIWESLRTAVSQNRDCVLLSSMAGHRSQHFLVYPNGKVLGGEPDEELLQAALKAWQQRKSQIIEREAGNYFALVIPRKCQLLIVGAAHISADLVHLARQFDFETIVVDPRGIFSNNTQFLTQPDHKYAKWPEEVLPDLPLDAYTFAVTLTHDPKIDDQALKLLLRSEVAYIGSLGSSRTHAKRLARLHKAGFTEEETSRIHGPIGLDIHAKLPREIALSIMAEIIRIKNQHL